MPFAPSIKIDYVAYMTHIAAVIMTFLELREDLTDYYGHAQGLCLLVASKICREIHALRGLTLANNSSFHHRSIASMVVQYLPEPPLGVALQIMTIGLGQALGILASNITATVLAFGALAAALVEVFDNVEGHKGAIMLALMDLMELSEQAGIVQLQQIHGLQYWKIGLAAGATVVALSETLDSSAATVGSHHGILALATFKFVRMMGRRHFFKVVRKADTKRILKALQAVGILRNEVKVKKHHE